jgi:hypothetical protein
MYATEELQVAIISVRPTCEKAARLILKGELGRAKETLSTIIDSDATK